jgi:nucleoside-diphosphate-sugar epimerase
MKNVLITGVSGALGRAVANRVKQLGAYKIFTTTRKQTSTDTDLLCDLSNTQQLHSALEVAKPDLILHLAANFASDFNECFTLNVESSKSILDYIKSRSLSTRVVLIGSAAEYGAVQPHENPIREDQVLAPVSIYGLSKAWQTQLVSMYSQHVDVICARVFNLYGEGLSDRLFFGRFAVQLEEIIAGNRQSIEVGPLSATRDYISTIDAAEQVLAIAEHGKRGKVYHVASGVPVTMRDFAQAQLKASGLETVKIIEAAATSNHNGYDVPVIYADITQTKNLLKGLI